MGHAVVANQVPVEHTICAYIGQFVCQARGCRKYEGFCRFHGKMRLPEISRRRIALRRTTALREPENYGLRGWISTRSNDPAEVLQTYFRWPFVRGRIVQHLSPSGGMLWGSIKGARAA
jgi:hypothetical protein